MSVGGWRVCLLKITSYEKSLTKYYLSVSCCALQLGYLQYFNRCLAQLLP